MTILITGANGTIGSDLVTFFSRNYKVFALYRTPNFVSKNLRNKNIRWIKKDLKKKILCKINPKIIIHCAISHEFSKKNTYLDLLNSNVIALKNVIEFANKKKISKLFNFSSVSIYGNIQNKIHEDRNIFINPNYYGTTKIISEKMLELHKFSFLNIRLPGVLSYNLYYPTRPWLNTVIDKLKKNKIINIYNSKKLFNNTIDTVEIYKFINYIIKKKNMRSGSLNFSAIKPIKVKSMIYNLRKRLSSKSKIVFKKEKSKHFIILSTKAFKDYGFNIATTSEIINRYLGNHKFTNAKYLNLILKK